MNPTRSSSSFQRLLITAACLAALAGCQTTPDLTAASGFTDPKAESASAPVIDFSDSNGPPQAGGGWY